VGHVSEFTYRPNLAGHVGRTRDCDQVDVSGLKMGGKPIDGLFSTQGSSQIGDMEIALLPRQEISMVLRREGHHCGPGGERLSQKIDGVSGVAGEDYGIVAARPEEGVGDIPSAFIGSSGD
jgi:hypothetical protein